MQEKKLASKSRYSVMVMNEKKYKMLEDLQKSFCSDTQKNIAIPGLLSANVS